jgi:hypothetical protein
MKFTKPKKPVTMLEWFKSLFKREPETKWATGEAKCGICNQRWIAVYAEEAEDILECPHCGSVSQYTVVTPI